MNHTDFPLGSSLASSKWAFFNPRAPDYHAIEVSGDHDQETGTPSSTPDGKRITSEIGRNPCDAKKNGRRIIFLTASAVTLAFVVIGTVLLSTIRGHKPSTQFICGKTTAEARAAGCSWDQLMWAWYPPQCPHYANDDFLTADDWKFFSDPWGKEATDVEWEQAMNNEIRLFSRHGEHLTHCLFFFLSVGQVLRDGTPATPKLHNYEHLQHCVKMLLPVVRGHANYSMINTKTPSVSYEEYC